MDFTKTDCDILHFRDANGRRRFGTLGVFVTLACICRGKLRMPAEQKLYIHAGQTKTGSSFLQAAFAGSIDALKSMGIVYPIDRKLAELARTGIPTSGNIDDGAPDLPQLIVRTFKSTRPNSCLLSNERIFDPLVRGDTLEKLRQGMPNAQIKVLFFVRDPLEHVISSYQQASKLRNDIGSFALRYGNAND